jgi:hypothetical protein
MKISPTIQHKLDAIDAVLTTTTPTSTSPNSP